MEWLRRLDDFGYEKTRRALAALALSFFATLYLLISLNAPDGWGPAFLALGACYVVAFLGLAAEWFWGRWFASGLGYSGVMVAVISLVMIGFSPPLIVYGALHGLVVVGLLGKRMVALYDLQEGWRKRFAMDELGVARLRKTVTRAAASLPSVILWALAPKQPGDEMLAVVFSALAVVGLAGVLRLRSWGLLAIAGSAVGLLLQHGHLAIADGFGAQQTLGLYVSVAGRLGGTPGLMFAPLGALAGAVLLAAVLPFARPALSFLRRR